MDQEYREKLEELGLTIELYTLGSSLYPKESLRRGIHYDAVDGGLFPVAIPEEGTTPYFEREISRLVRELIALEPSEEQKLSELVKILNDNTDLRIQR